MAQSVIINGVTYPDAPAVDIPKSGGGTATFWDASGADFVSADLRNGKKAVGAEGEVTGNMSEKAAASYNPSTTDQIIPSGQYLAGVQTFKAVTVSNLQPQYIANGVVVKVGCADDDDAITAVTGTLSSVVVSQDPTTKVLSIS